MNSRATSRSISDRERKNSKKLSSILNIQDSVNIDGMVEFPFNWNLQSGNIYNQKKNCYHSDTKINAEWSLVCLWSNNNRPQFLEIRRNSKAKEILVSGTFKLWLNSSECVLQRKFIQLIEAGFQCAATPVELEYYPTNNWNDDYYYSTYSITGTLTIPADLAHKDYAKEVQFESLLNLSSDFECLLDPKAAYFSDISLECGTVSLSAHKNILSARSPVFAAMFATQMKENQLNKVDIIDISPHVLKIMLTYLYTGKTRELSVQTAAELLFAADKYELQDLKRVCSDYLKSCVSSQNILNILVLGYLHDQDLKVFAMDFICNSSGEFGVMEQTVEWMTLREKRPALAMDVLTCLVKAKDKKLKERKK